MQFFFCLALVAISSASSTNQLDLVKRFVQQPPYPQFPQGHVNPPFHPGPVFHGQHDPNAYQQPGHPGFGPGNDAKDSGSDSNGDGNSDSSFGISSESKSVQSYGSGSDSNLDGDSDSSMGKESDATNSNQGDSRSDANGDGYSDSSEDADNSADGHIQESSFADSDYVAEVGSNSDSNGDGNSDSSAEGGNINKLTDDVVLKFMNGKYNINNVGPVSPYFQQVLRARMAEVEAQYNSASVATAFSSFLMLMACRLVVNLF